MDAKFFDAALHARGVTKKEFALKNNIPYNTVTGWKKRGVAPNYALQLLKNMPFNTGSVEQKIQKRYLQETTPINPKIITAAFWGKNYTFEEIIENAKGGDPKFLLPLFENVFYKDIARALGIDSMNKLLPVLKKILKPNEVKFWIMFIKTNRELAR